MILQNTKSESAGFSLMQLLGGTSKEKTSTTFSLLLQQLGIDSEVLDMKTGPINLNELLVEEKPNASKVSSKNVNADTLLTLLQNDNENLEILNSLIFFEEGSEEDIKILNPKLMQTLPILSLKEVIADAKVYIKDQIKELALSKGIEIDIETLPKTLKSLSLVAEKIGIQLDKITLESIQTKGSILEQNDKETSILQPQKRMPEHSTQEFVRIRKEQMPNETSSAAKLLQTSQNNEPLKTLLHVPVLDKKELHNTKRKAEPLAAVQKVQQIDEDIKENIKVNIPQEISKSTKMTRTVPMNTQISQAVADIGAVNTKELKTTAFKQELKTVQPVSETVIESAEETVVTAVTEKLTKSSSDIDNTIKLRSLLHAQEGVSGDAEEQSEDSKVAVLTAKESKTAVLDVKINEAKQMVSHLATELKEAVENYKPPFTRIKLQLNPVKLGEVDVTMVQRGNNVHINVSSNNSAIAILAQNSVELKNQLANSGLANATMQFNTNGGEQQRQNQHQQNMRETYEKYAALENEENFEILHSLELIVPRYG